MNRTLSAILMAAPLFAQSEQNMPGMDHSMPGMDPAAMYLMNLASGTSMNPESWHMPMLMPSIGSWNFMIMARAFIVATQQSAPRGGDKLYGPNWAMFSAEHSFAGGSILLQSMFSLDPATITNRSYPLLFQTGETAFGKPLVDAQHPHDFFMGLGIHYARSLGENTILHFYYAPVGDPALGPVAFPHRASAGELPQATLGHHWQDSTHIADNVFTAALKYRWLRLEASSFYGTEPGEHRWLIDWGTMNSYAGRLSVSPSKNWTAQVSAGRLTKPERQSAGDVVRITSSIHYTRSVAGSSDWSSSLIWGRNHDNLSRHNLNSYLAETVYPLTPRNVFTGRVELVDKDELFADNPAFEAQLDHTAGSTFRIKSFTAGYTRYLARVKDIDVGLGANATAYGIPSAIQPYYGEHPWGVNLFVSLRLKP